MREKTKGEIFRLLSYALLIGAFTVAFIYLLVYGQRNAEQLEFARSKQEYLLDQSVLLKTSEGNIHVNLDASSAPISVYSFVTLSKSGFYNDSIFSNAITDYYIVGGKRTANSATSSASVSRHLAETYKETDSERSPTQGDVLLINTGPDKKEYRFLIVTTDNLPLLEKFKGRFPIVGKVISGMEVIDRIERLYKQKKEVMLKETRVL